MPIYSKVAWNREILWKTSKLPQVTQQEIIIQHAKIYKELFIIYIPKR